MRHFMTILSVSVALSSCSTKLQIELFNNTGEIVTVSEDDKKLTVYPAQFREFGYPGNEQRWTLYISTTQCDYTYEVPRAFEHYPSTEVDEPLKTQVNKDFSIYLLPALATVIADVKELGPVQQNGFPLHPVSKNCR